MTEQPVNTASTACVQNSSNKFDKNSKARTMHINTLQNEPANYQLRPIGLFDSGVGGLSVFVHLKQVLPDEQYIYYADTLNVPYGTRCSKEITALTLKAIDWLVSHGCKIIVIACNSASAHALEVARNKYPNIPIVGLVPALKPAVLASVSKKVAVLATKATLEGALLNDVITEYAKPAGVEVVKCFDPTLVPWVESGMAADNQTAKRLRSQLHEFAEQKIDNLVLGCTHYPFFKEFVLSEVRAHNLGITVVDSGAAIANRVYDLLATQNKLAKINPNNGDSISDDSLKTPQTAPKNSLVISTVSSYSAIQNEPVCNDAKFNDLVSNNTVSKNTASKNTVIATTINNHDIVNNSNIASNHDSASEFKLHEANFHQWQSAKLAFFITDPNSDLKATEEMVKRLIHTSASL